MNSEFVHLHLHSQYSLLDGAILLPRLFPALKERNMDTVALTDHGVMYGILDFYLKAHSNGIKPILGCETYVAKNSMTEKTKENYHLILLAKNEVGFKNLQYIISMAALKGFYYRPRIDRDLLREYSAGLVGLSACLAGEIPRTYFKTNYQKAKEKALEYAGIFEENSFYLELQHNRLEEQDELNEILIKMSADTGIPLVATNDCHYINKEDAKAQEILMAISQGKKLSDKNRLHHEVDEFYLKTPEEMMTAFASVPQAIENTVKIANMCNVKIPNNKMAKKPVYFLPDFPTPNEMSQEEYLRLQSKKGLEDRLEKLTELDDLSASREDYFKRLEIELEVIIGMGFPGYFLIVSDFITWAKQQNIPVGPGRGSGAGSLVAYALKITDLDPLKYNLLFERFLNPERISMPDFDVDFCRSRRDEVLNYVKEKYGKNKVAQITTFSTLKSRAVIRDVGRVMGIHLSIVDKIAKLVPSGKSVEEALELEPRLASARSEDSEIKDLLDMSVKLEGTYRHPGIHAAGVVIGKEDIWNTVPCTKAKTDAKTGEDSVIPLVTQYEKNMVELAGLVKFDFLGLDNLTKIDEAIKRINIDKKENEKFDITKIPLDDPNVYNMLSRGETGGVFQMESDGFTTLLKKLKPDRFEDIIAVVALYRPGPLGGGMVDDYIDCKHGRKAPVYPHPKLESVLSETYGVMVYQEQVMQSARTLAGFSLGDADLMRRAMGKKKPEVMQKMKADFIKGCANNGISEKDAVTVFETIEKFAKYGFNKSHSAAYALIGYQTAYLRYYYPVEFIAGILSCERNKPDKVMKYLIVAKKMGITVLSPDINESMEDFTVIKNKKGKKVIRFGLGAVKGVGDTAVKSVIEARNDGPFEGLYDICRRADLRKVNKSVLEAMIKSGALDSLYNEKNNIVRPALLQTLEHAIKTGQRYQKEKNSNQIGLFDVLGDSNEKVEEPSIDKDVIPWANIELLSNERSVIGVYLSGHPLENYFVSDEKKGYGVMKEWDQSVGELADMQVDSSRYIRGIKTLGVISKIEEKRQRDSKRRYATGEIDGMDGVIEFYVSPDKYENMEELLKSGEPFLIEGDLRISEISEGNYKKSIYLNNITNLDANRKDKIKHLVINLDTNQLPLFFRNDGWLKEISEILSKNPGKVQVYVHISEQENWESIIRLNQSIKITNPFIARISQLFGERNVVFLQSTPKLRE